MCVKQQQTVYTFTLTELLMTKVVTYQSWLSELRSFCFIFTSSFMTEIVSDSQLELLNVVGRGSFGDVYSA